MHKETITYEDYNGNERTEDFYFNLSKAELAEMELSTQGGFKGKILKIIAAQDTPTLIQIFKDLILKSFGVKSDDGRRFEKSEELSVEFSQTEAYSDLFMKLATDSDAAATFVNEIVPKDIANKVNEATSSNGTTPLHVVETETVSSPIV